MSAFTSTNGGKSWNAAGSISSAPMHGLAGGLRSFGLPSTAIDSAGTVYVSWPDCRFESGCSANDIVFNDAHAQWYLAVGTPVLQCVEPCRSRRDTTRSAHPQTWQRTSFSSARSRIQRPVPEIRIDPDAPKVSDGSGMAIVQVIPATRRSGRDCPILCGQRLRHVLLPFRQVSDTRSGEREISGV